jgi:hypothetical protein
MGEVHRDLDRAIFIARHVSTTQHGEHEYDVKLRVQEVLRGDVHQTTTVRAQNSSCGLPTWVSIPGHPPDGDHVVFATYDPDDGYDGLRYQIGCDRPSATELRESLAMDLPPRTGSGPVAAVASVDHHWATLVALDADGGVLGWGGRRQWPARQLLECVGHSSYVIEHHTINTLQLRHLPTMQIIAEATAPQWPDDSFDVACDPSESEPLTVVQEGLTGQTKSEARLLSVAGSDGAPVALAGSRRDPKVELLPIANGPVIDPAAFATPVLYEPKPDRWPYPLPVLSSAARAAIAAAVMLGPVFFVHHRSERGRRPWDVG